MQGSLADPQRVLDLLTIAVGQPEGPANGFLLKTIKIHARQRTR